MRRLKDHTAREEVDFFESQNFKSVQNVETHLKSKVEIQGYKSKIFKVSKLYFKNPMTLELQQVKFSKKWSFSISQS